MKLRLAALLLAASVLPFAAPVAASASSSSVLPVTDGSGPQVDLYTQTVDLAAGDRLYIASTPIAMANGSWGSGSPTNVGVTTRIICTTGGVQVMNVHHGENNTPTYAKTYPVVRGMLVAEEAGSYACTLQGRAYSTAWAPGMGIRVLGSPGFTTQVVDGASRAWTDADTAVLPGESVAKMVTTLTGVSGQNVTAIADAQFTICKTVGNYPPLCLDENDAVSMTIKTRLELQPLDAGGGACGAKYVGPYVQVDISVAVHHKTVANQLAAYVSSGCPNAQVSLVVTNVAGNIAVSHGGYNYAHAMAIL